MKNVLRLFFLIGCCCVAISAQGPVVKPVARVSGDLRKLVETELAFAKTAAEKGTRTAFLSFLADHGIIFSPIKTNGIASWRARSDSPALLSWKPAWADVSSDGKLGYTTGGWELRPQGKNDEPTTFGQYVTIWEKQSDGKYKAVLDIDISHPNPASLRSDWKYPPDARLGVKEVKNGVSDSTLTDIFSNKSMANGYFNYLAEDAIVLREGRLPFVGRHDAFIGLEQLDKEFPASSFLNFNAETSKVYGNLMYVHGVYQLTNKDESISRWNFVQIWKFRDERWQIVLDVFNPIAPEKK